MNPVAESDASADSAVRGLASLFAARLSALRRGTTVVETALVLPVFLVFVLGIIELGHAQMVKNLLRSGCREAARIGSTEGNTTAEVQQRVLDVIGSAIESGIDPGVREGCERVRRRRRLDGRRVARRIAEHRARRTPSRVRCSWSAPK